MKEWLKYSSKQTAGNNPFIKLGMDESKGVQFATQAEGLRPVSCN